MDSYLAVPQSFLMEGNQSSLSRRHTFSAGSRSRPSSVGGVTGVMGMMTIGGDVILPSASGPTVTLPLPNAPTTPLLPKGTSVASEAIIAACTGRRQREAKFACDLCPQTFTAKHNLINHKKAHSGIKDQICDGCGHGFTAPGTLKRHIKTCKAMQLEIL
ncbi:hypothetical protein H1R20_g7724, partial [Candolleomyces eurysporus]